VSLNGFLKGAELVYRAGIILGDYHSQDFESGCLRKVLPNLPASHVAMLHNTPYRCKQEDKPSSKYSDWL